jgi:uncharacterized damage-inducible protein DinB
MKFTMLALAVLSLPAVAQTTIKDSLVKHWKVTGSFTIAVANKMPAEDYDFRPNPVEMSFGELMAHIGLANVGACSIASGLERPALPAKIAEWAKSPEKVEVGKATAVQFLTESFDFCNKAVASMTPQRLDKVVGPGKRKMTGFEWLWAYFTHTAHHRGQAEVYMRVKGIAPPLYEF